MNYNLPQELHDRLNAANYYYNAQIDLAFAVVQESVLKSDGNSVAAWSAFNKYHTLMQQEFWATINEYTPFDCDRLELPFTIDNLALLTIFWRYIQPAKWVDKDNKSDFDIKKKERILEEYAVGTVCVADNIQLLDYGDAEVWCMRILPKDTTVLNEIYLPLKIVFAQNGIAL